MNSFEQPSISKKENDNEDVLENIDIEKAKDFVLSFQEKRQKMKDSEIDGLVIEEMDDQELSGMEDLKSLIKVDYDQAADLFDEEEYGGIEQFLEELGGEEMTA